ncbi:hypothetical protein Droror1_Dr00011166 [Drosera rotundifolia]
MVSRRTRGVRAKLGDGDAGRGLLVAGRLESMVATEVRNYDGRRRGELIRVSSRLVVVGFRLPWLRTIPDELWRRLRTTAASWCNILGWCTRKFRGAVFGLVGGRGSSLGSGNRRIWFVDVSGGEAQWLTAARCCGGRWQGRWRLRPSSSRARVLARDGDGRRRQRRLWRTWWFEVWWVMVSAEDLVREGGR